jgi:hypothetical protein
MPETIKTGTILFKAASLIPEALLPKSKWHVPRWRIVKNLDGFGLERKIREAHWNCFYLAGAGDTE